MSTSRLVLFASLALSLAVALACGGGDKDGDKAAAEPTAQDTGDPEQRAKAEVQATVAAVQANTDAEVQAQADAQAQAAETDQCAPREAIANAGPDCVTATIACGETVEGTTVGGGDHFDGDRYLHSYCFPTTIDSHKGPDRVYALNIEAGQRATIKLKSPCADLDLAVLRWQKTGSCPGPSAGISECEGVNKSGGGKAQVWNNRPARYLVVVDGNDPVGANFEISVSCEDSEI